MSIDVLIVGAGPVGLTLAVDLARYGAKVRIIDQGVHEMYRSRPLFLWSRTLELLDRSGGTSEFVAAGQKLTAANIVARGKSIGHIDFAAVDSTHPYMLTLPEGKTEELLEAQLSTFGVQVERDCTLVSISHTGTEDDRSDGIKAVLSRTNAPQDVVQTKWLVGCDGVRSTVRKFLEMPVQDVGKRSDWLLADVHLSGMGTNASEFTVYWHDKGAVSIFPIRDGAYRVIADMGKATTMKRLDPTLEELQAILDERISGGLKASNPDWLYTFRQKGRKLRDYRMGRVFLAGGAAHVHSPIGVQGLNTGMQDAVNLAWKLALVLRGTCPEEKLLPSYNIERSAVSDRVTTTVNRLTMAANMRNQPLQTIRNLLGGAMLGLTNVRQALADNLTEVSLGYASSPLNGPDERVFPGPAPGDRMPPVAGEIPVGSGDVPRFVLYADVSPEISKILEDHADLLEPNLRKPLSTSCVWLVRPDGYVAAVTLDLDTDVIARYLATLKGR